MKSKGVFSNEDDLRKELLANEVHIIVGTPNTDELSFPSKIWNSIASGRKVVACGMIGKMNMEFETSLNSNYQTHLPNLVEFIISKTKK